MKKLITLIIIMILFLLAAWAGHPQPVGAAGAGLNTLTTSTLSDGRAETVFCQVGADKEQYLVSMYVYPWEGTKGFPLVLYLDWESSNGNCHTFSAEWHPLNNGLYHADTYVSRGGGDLIFYHDSARFARLWLPMAFTGYPESRPEVGAQ